MAINKDLITEVHTENLDISKKVGGYVEVDLKELHLDNHQESFDGMNLHFIMSDTAGNKRILSVNFDQFDDALRELGYKIYEC